MTDLPDRLNGIIERRKQQLPDLERIEAGWRQVQSLTRELQRNLDEAATQGQLDDETRQVIHQLQALRTNEGIARIEQTLTARARAVQS